MKSCYLQMSGSSTDINQLLPNIMGFNWKVSVPTHGRPASFAYQAVTFHSIMLKHWGAKTKDVYDIITDKTS